MEKVFDLFSNIYKSSAGDGAFLAFEKLGVPITQGMFKLQPTDTTFSTALAVERLSEIANAVLEVDGDTVRRSNRTVPAMTELMLTQSMPLTSDTDAIISLGKAKSAASQAFDTTLGSLDGMFRFHAVYANPVDWYDPAAKDNWTLHTIGKQVEPPRTTPPSHPKDPRLWDASDKRPTWRVVPSNIQPTLSKPISRTHPIYAALSASDRAALVRNSSIQSTQVSLRPQVMAIRREAPPIKAQATVSPGLMRRATMGGTAIVSRSPSGAAGSAFAGASQAAAPTVPTMSTAGPLMMAEATAQLNFTTTPQPVSANSIDMSFDHCVVTLNRSWWPEVFVMLKNWFVPGYGRAAFSDGTGSGDSGLLSVLTSGFVAIRNLKISTKWSTDDLVAMQGAASFGPFSLVGRSYDAATRTLTCPGIQLIGWFCEALPILPPASDPTMAAP
jgi:hypothetical protein